MDRQNKLKVLAQKQRFLEYCILLHLLRAKNLKKYSMLENVTKRLTKKFRQKILCKGHQVLDIN